MVKLFFHSLCVTFCRQFNRYRTLSELHTKIHSVSSSIHNIRFVSNNNKNFILEFFCFSKRTDWCSSKPLPPPATITTVPHSRKRTKTQQLFLILFLYSLFFCSCSHISDFCCCCNVLFCSFCQFHPTLLRYIAF